MVGDEVTPGKMRAFSYHLPYKLNFKLLKKTSCIFTFANWTSLAIKMIDEKKPSFSKRLCDALYINFVL